MKNPFEVGETYRNNLGEYEVISIDEPDMTIQLEDGRTIETTVKLQARIWKRVKWGETPQEADQARAAPRTSSQVQVQGAEGQGLPIGVKGTSWRARTGLGGLMADKLTEKTPYDFQSYAVYGRPENHIVLPDYYDKKRPLEERQICLGSQRGTRPLRFLHREEADPEKVWDWSRFVEALSTDEDLQDDTEETMRQMNLHWELYSGEEGDEFLGRAKIADDETIEWEGADGEIQTLTWETFADLLQELDEDTWYHLYLCDVMEKDETIEQARRIAELTTDIFRMLLPLYEASTQCDA